MKRKDYELISNSNSTLFKEEVKRFLEAHQNALEITTTYCTTNKGHFAHIDFSYLKDIAENVKDDYILRGERYYCCNCPFWGSNATDDVDKAMSCTIQVRNKDTRYCSDACLRFYQLLADGEITPCDYEYDPDRHRREKI